MNYFEQYGLKEVANVTFYNIEDGKPVLFLDSLKVSNIEQTAENTDARGGWGNPALVSWDYNKDVNVTLEDALFSATSLKVMMGAGFHVPTASNTEILDINEEIKLDNTGKGKLTGSLKAGEVARYFDDVEGAFIDLEVSGGEFTIEGKANKTVRVFYKAEVDNDAKGTAMVITIDAGTFGGTYKIVGDTLVRSRETGKDEAFQFVINKAKINSEITFTMQAEGDPTTFNMPIRVLKDSEGNMFKLIKYSLPQSM